MADYSVRAAFVLIAPRQPCPVADLHRLFALRADGMLIRKARAGAFLEGTIAGHREKTTGYWVVSVAGFRVGAHRVVWALEHGVWPAGQIDHRNGVRDDNRPENLRESTHGQNQWNRRKFKRNTSGRTGAFFQAATGRWFSQVKQDGVTHYLGTFDTADEAADAYDAFVKAHRGEFDRTLRI